MKILDISVNKGLCRNPNLGLMTKARVYKGAGQEWSLGITFHAPGSVGKFEGMNLHTPKWALTLGVKVLMDSQIFRERLQESKFMYWRVHYIIGKFLELKCFKWARMTHLGTWNTSYGQKKGQESNCQFDSRPLKVGNHSSFLVCRWCANIVGKLLTRHTALLQSSLQSKVCTQSYGVPILEISGFPRGSLGTKWHLGVVPMAKLKEYYKGEGGGFPQVRAVMSLVSPWLFVVCPCTKSVPTMH
jgi:hypothetical protein